MFAILFAAAIGAAPAPQPHVHAAAADPHAAHAQRDGAHAHHAMMQSMMKDCARHMEAMKAHMPKDGHAAHGASANPGDKH